MSGTTDVRNFWLIENKWATWSEPDGGILTCQIMQTVFELSEGYTLLLVSDEQPTSEQITAVNRSGIAPDARSVEELQTKL